MNNDQYSIREVIPYGRTPEFIEHVRLDMLRRSGLELLKTFESGKMYTVRMVEERRTVRELGSYAPPHETDTEITFRFEIGEVEVRQHHIVMADMDYPNSWLVKSALSEIKNRIRGWVYLKRLRAENFFRRMGRRND